MQANIFYSWQSDLPNPINRGFIQKALEKAAKAIREDDSIIVEPVIDRDTAGVAGSPDIGTTILDKIDACHVFVADVSIINSGSDERPTPNPNVLIEFGYALKRLGWERIVMVQNTAFGPPDSLPFDLRGKRVLTYDLPDAETDRSEARNALGGKLNGALELILKETEDKGQEVVEEPQNPLNVTIDRVDVRIASERHDYKLEVKITNIGADVIKEYWVDVMFPTGLMDNPKSHGQYVRDLDGGLYSLFRITSEYLEPIYPGDPVLVMTLPYYLDHNTFESKYYLINKTVVWVTANASGFPPRVVERPMEEMQKF